MRLDCVSISSPLQPLQQRCAEQPITNLGMGEGRQRECDGLYHSLQCCPGCPRASGDVRSASFCPFNPTKVWAYSAQRRQTAMHTTSYGDRHTHVWPLEPGHVQGPHRRDTAAPRHKGGANPPPHGTAVGVPHTRRRKGLSCTGPCMETQSSREHCRMTSRCRGKDCNTVLPCSCQQDVGYVGWHGRKSGFKSSS